MKSLHIIQSLDGRLGGLAHAALGVCRYLEEAGVPATLATTRTPEDDLGYLADAYPQVRPVFFPRSFPARLHNSSALVRWMEEQIPAYDLVELHAVFSLTTLRGAAACRRAGKPYFLRPHGSLDPFDLQKKALLKRWLGPVLWRPVLAGAAAVLLTSEMELERLVTYGATPRREAIPLPVAGQPAGDGAEFRRRHGIPPDAQVVLFLSRIDYKKGLEFLIPALASLKARHPHLWFVMAGSGTPSYASGIERLLTDHRMNDWTTRPGFIGGTEKAGAFAASQVFALPSLNENFGIAVVEALQSGLPALISDQVYIHREIAAGGAARVCHRSTESVAKELSTLLAQPGSLVEMGNRARQLAQARFSPRAATERLLATYARVLGRDRESVR